MINAKPTHRFQHRFALIVIFLLISGFYITLEIGDQFRPVRFTALGILLLSIGLSVVSAIQKDAIKTTIAFQLLAHLFLLAYGILGSLVFGGFRFFEDQRLIAFLLISLILSYVLTQLQTDFKTRQFANLISSSWLLDVFFIAGLSYIFFSGVMTFSPLPVFNFIGKEGDVDYSQDTTALFGLGASYFLYRAAFNKAISRFLYLFLAISFLFLSVFGGARGDFVVSILVFILILFRLYSLLFKLLFSVISVTVIICFLFAVDISDIVLYQRFQEVFEGYLGLRDVLLSQTADLLASKPACLISGCGFNFFQFYYGYEFGMYPHNIIAELLITYGVFIALPIVALLFVGIWRAFWGDVGTSFVFYFCIFQIGIALKSGVLVSMTAIPVILFFCSFAFVRSSSYKTWRDNQVIGERPPLHGRKDLEKMEPKCAE